jgi:transposase
MCILGQTWGMHKPYSRDLRERALRQLDAGRPVHEIADLFSVHRTTLLRWRQRLAMGELEPRPRPGRTPKIGPAEQLRLIAQVQAAPDATLREHCTAWEAATGVAVSEATMCRALQKVRWTLKKRA